MEYQRYSVDIPIYLPDTPDGIATYLLFIKMREVCDRKIKEMLNRDLFGPRIVLK